MRRGAAVLKTDFIIIRGEYIEFCEQIFSFRVAKSSADINDEESLLEFLKGILSPINDLLKQVPNIKQEKINVIFYGDVKADDKKISLTTLMDIVVDALISQYSATH